MFGGKTDMGALLSTIEMNEDSKWLALTIQMSQSLFRPKVCPISDTKTIIVGGYGGSQILSKTVYVFEFKSH